jgi:glycyl-tRNA synthetase
MAEENLMDKIVSLCKRRGFLFQSSEIYGGINGFWDYGPLGVELKRNVKEAWWQEMVTRHDNLSTLPNAPDAYNMVGLDCSIIMHPQVWKVSGHFDLFSDMMVDCTETKERFRFDHLKGRWAEYQGNRVFVTTNKDSDEGLAHVTQAALSFFKLRNKDVEKITFGTGPHGGLSFDGKSAAVSFTPAAPVDKLVDIWHADTFDHVLAPTASKPGTLTKPREFNLMFKTIIGATGTEQDAAFLRPETAQGIFANFKNVVDSSRVKVPFGICQIGKSFRNEITPRNFTFRSREFEQMELEFFCNPSTSLEWYTYWRNRRFDWYLKLGINSDKLRLREHDKAEIAHYSVGTADIEYAFPFLEVGDYGELEGIAHRGDFDLRSHMEGKLKKDENGNLVPELNADGQPKWRGSGKDLTYFDDQTRERFVPHVIEPSAGADRGTLAFICEAYYEDEAPDEDGKMQSRTVMRFHPKLAPVKAAIFPLIKKEGMPETAANIYREFKEAGLNVVYDQQAAIGRRYRRQDEIGTPYCITVDGDTAKDGAVTLRDRDTLEQTRIPMKDVVDEVIKRIRQA